MAVYKIQGNDNRVYDAPPWFVDWVLLGMRLFEQCQGGPKPKARVIAVWAPTIDFAASAIAFGFIRNRLIRQGPRTIDQATPGEQDLRGKRIWFRIGDTVRTAVLIDHDIRSLSTTTGKFLRTSITDLRAIPPWARSADSKTTVQSNTPSPHFASLYRSLSYDAFLTEWSEDVGIVGDLCSTEEELNCKFGPNDGTENLGSFGESVRPFRTSSPASWRSLLASDRGSDLDHSVLEIPALKILRGALATSKYLTDVPSGPIVTLLGQNEPQVGPAVDAVMQRASYSSVLTKEDLQWNPPFGVEVHAFEFTI